jgi:hypothetical protein
MIETQVDNLNMKEEANDFMASKKFAENPIGTNFDPEDLRLGKIRQASNRASKSGLVAYQQS